MSLTVQVAPYGPPAGDALANALAEAQAGDPLRLVTVVVSRVPVGLAARRRLAARPGGLVNVRFLTLPDLAGMLLPPAELAGRRPLDGTVLQAVARSALATAGTTQLGPAAEQPATVRALVRTYHELRGASRSTLAELAGRNDRLCEVVGLVSAMHDRLAGYYDDRDLIELAAIGVARAPDRLPGLTGPVVLYLPGSMAPVDRALVRALAAAGPVVAIVGATGDAVADADARALVADLRGAAPRPPTPGGVGGSGPIADPFPVAVPRLSTVTAAPTADAEVLLAVRRLMAHHTEGVPLERMAVLHPARAPYPRLVRDSLRRAGIPFNGTGIRPLAATVAGRALLGLFEAADRGWRRDDVARWLSSTPLRYRRRPVPGSAWDRLSCEAGVVQGLDAWRTRPLALAAAFRGRVASGGPADDPATGALERDARHCEGLAAFVGHLADRLAETPSGWTAWAGWARRLLEELLGPAADQREWTSAEVAALGAVNEALLRLAGLDRLAAGPPSPAGFRAALAAELEVPAPQTTRFGQGVLVGRVAEAVGLDLDVVCVVGMVDGAFPERSVDDVLVPDRDREPFGDQIPLRASRAAEGRRDYLAALAAAPARLVSYATGDQRSGQGQRPSRLLLDGLADLAGDGRRLYARDLPDLGPVPGYLPVPSYAAAVTGPPGADEPISVADWDLQSLLRWTQAGGRPGRHFLVRADPVLGRGMALRRERRRAVFTRFDGRVDGAPVPSPAAEGAAVSPTGLEGLATCPRRYLFGSVLGIRTRERPEAVLRIGPAERGTLVHRILEAFVDQELRRPPGDRSGPDTPWDAAAADRLAEIASAAFAELEQRGLAGRPPLWAVDRGAILGDLRQFLRDDDRYRRRIGAVPEAVEQSFGRDGTPPLSVRLADGRSVRFRGTVDRIDRTGDGGLSVVDYKTGARHGTDGLADDPVAGGTRLQLLLYGLAAAEHYRPRGPVTSSYWFVGARGRSPGQAPLAGVALSARGERRLAEVLGVLVQAIETGTFPANPGPPTARAARGSHCTVCPFDRICPSDRLRDWQRKRADPWVADYLALGQPA